jgi:hypothetical protein
MREGPAGARGGDQASGAEHRQVLADTADLDAGSGGQAGGGRGIGERGQQFGPPLADEPREIAG